MLSRADSLAALQREAFDVVVIGGGITGAGVALDAATRGFSVALVERDDFSCGTSSRSSKMVHGGLRYLQNFDLGLVREALVERQLMVRLAPHLVRPLPFLVPAFEGARRDLRIGVGLNMYDAMSLRNPRARRRAAREAALEGGEYWSPDRHRTIDRDEVLELIPALAGRDPSSAYLFYDCQTDDSRLVLTVLGEAVRFGAVCVNGAAVVEVLEERGRAAGVVCEEQESGERFAVAAANVVNATGVWADRIRPEEIHGEEDVPVIRPSRGTHVLLDRERLPMNAAAVLPAADPKKSVDISRRAELYETSSGMVTITGGKLTTWRRMAKMVVDRIVEREFREAPCHTHEIPLGHPVEPGDLPDVPGVGEASRAHLAARYGLFAESVLKICAERPELTRPIVEGMPDLLAEAVVAARHEQARTVADVLLRRTRLGLLAGRRLLDDRDAVRRVARAMGPELSWGRRETRHAVEAWPEAAAAERLVTREPVRA
jgi:glycerol-3-phosphate dehydrogenase